MDVELHLPFPPTVNNYYVKTKRGVFISAKGKRFRSEIEESVVMQAPLFNTDEKVMVEVILYPPDKRKRDLDNYMKALLDSLTECGVWEDDSQVDQLHIYRGSVVKGGKVFMRIGESGPVIPMNREDLI